MEFSDLQVWLLCFDCLDWLLVVLCVWLAARGLAVRCLLSDEFCCFGFVVMAVVWVVLRLMVVVAG